MIGIDTNVLVRSITFDDPEQSPKAEEFLRAAQQRGEPLFVNVIVLCELAWTLCGKRFRYARGEVADTLEELLAVGVFRIQHRDEVKRAIHAFRRGNADFADYLIGGLNGAAGCEDTATFDGKLAGKAGYLGLGSDSPPFG